MLKDTGSPARALQALRTTQYRMVYYDSFQAFTGPLGRAYIDYETSALAPNSIRGYVAVVAIIVAHLGIFVLVLVVFLRHTHWSFLENA